MHKSSASLDRWFADSAYVDIDAEPGMLGSMRCRPHVELTEEQAAVEAEKKAAVTAFQSGLASYNRAIVHLQSEMAERAKAAAA